MVDAHFKRKRFLVSLKEQLSSCNVILNVNFASFSVTQFIMLYAVVALTFESVSVNLKCDQLMILDENK